MGSDVDGYPPKLVGCGWMWIVLGLLHKVGPLQATAARTQRLALVRLDVDGYPSNPFTSTYFLVKALIS
jgi:hypothetical protein